MESVHLEKVRGITDMRYIERKRTKEAVDKDAFYEYFNSFLTPTNGWKNKGTGEYTYRNAIVRIDGYDLTVIDLNRQKFIVPLKAIFDYSISTLSSYDTVIKITTYNDVELTWNFL